MTSSSSGGFALFLTILALLIFAFFAFMGTEYLFEGDHQKVLLVCIPPLIILFIFVWLSHRVKRGRKKNIPLEVFSLLGALCIVGLGMIPFSQFVYTIEHKQEINQLVQDSRDAAKEIDFLYQKYVENRVNAYEKSLSKDDNRATKVESLKRRLLPSSRESISMQRAIWLDSLQTINLWNVATARNLYHIITASDEWTRQYAKVSEIIYQGETFGPFQRNDSEIKTKYEQFTTFHWPLTKWSIFAGLICCVLMFISYIVCTRSRNKFTGNHA